MARTTTAELLTAWKDRIAALVPLTSASPDDVYHVAVGLRIAYLGNRAVLLTCQPGRRVQGGRTCSDWEATCLIEAFYLDNPGAYEQATQDAEQICNDLYDWVASDAGQELGLLRVEPDLANIAGVDGELQVQRQIRFLYKGLE